MPALAELAVDRGRCMHWAQSDLPVALAFNERGDDSGIKLAAGLAFDLVDHLFHRPGLTVRPSMTQRIDNISHRDDPGLQRNGFADEAARIAAAVPMLMVILGDKLGNFYELGLSAGQDSGADHGMRPDELDLSRGKGSRLQQDP